MNNPQEFKEIIYEVAQVLNLSPALVEKDIYVTKALHTLADIEDKNFRLVFQGGTCLAKAHHLIKRMSEDIDFRIETLSQPTNLGKEATRRALRIFRHNIIDSLSDSGFAIDEAKVRVKDTGNFMSIILDYKPLFNPVVEMRPELWLEFITINTRIATHRLPISSLVSQVLGKHIATESKAITCISVLETAVEKWVALTRRVASIERGYRHKSKKDMTLVRHLYDLYMIHRANKFNDEC